MNRLRALAPVLLFFAFSAHCQIIGEIQVEGTSLSDPADILKAVQTQIGASLKSPATQRSISEDIRRINQLGGYDPLEIHAELRGSEALKTLVFHVIEYPVVADIEYIGNTKFKKKRLNTELGFDQAQNLFFRPNLIEILTEKLETFYYSKGFSNVIIEGREGEITSEGVVLEFVIEEGRKLKLQSIGFEGNSAFTDKELIDEIKSRPKVLGLFRRKFDEEKFEQDIRRLEYFYQTNGFLEAKIEQGTQRLVKKDKRLEVNFDINEGPQYRLGKIDVDGAATFTRSELINPIQVQRGDILDRPKLLEDLQEVRSLYWDQGFRLVDIEPEIVPNRETGIADLSLRIQEGPRLRLRSLQIEGVADAADGSVFRVPLETKEYVIERELAMAPGDVLDWSLVDETERRLINMQFFEREEGVFPPHLKHGFQLQPIPGSNEADLLLQVEEANTGFVSLGGGFSTDLGASLNFEFKDRNAFGRAWSYSLGADVGSRRTRVDLSFYNPHVNNSIYSNRYRLYYRDSSRIGAREFSEKRIGGSVAVGRQLWGDFRGSIEYGLEQVTIGDIDEEIVLRDADDNNATLVDKLFEDDSTITSRMSLGISRDTRDFVFFPTSGADDRVSLELAGLGGDNNFGGVSSTFNRYLKIISKMVLAFRVHGAASFPFGNTDRIPLHERYFLGGANTIRGFRSAGISPVVTAARRVTDIDGNEIFFDDEVRVGGEAEWYSNLELRYRWSDTVQSVAFFDSGSVFEEAGDFGFNETRASVGAGLRLNVFSNALVRLDLGFPIADEEHDEKQAFQFNFGASF